MLVRKNTVTLLICRAEENTSSFPAEASCVLTVWRCGLADWGMALSRTLFSPDVWNLAKKKKTLLIFWYYFWLVWKKVTFEGLQITSRPYYLKNWRILFPPNFCLVIVIKRRFAVSGHFASWSLSRIMKWSGNKLNRKGKHSNPRLKAD